MNDSPVDEIEIVSDTLQTAEETIKEYVVRVGEQNNVDQPLIEDALSYVTEYYYSEGIPEENQGFELFLSAITNADQQDHKDSAVDPPPIDETGESAESNITDKPVGKPPEGQSKADQSQFKTGIQGKEPRSLVLRFIIIVITAPVIGWMFARAWVPGNVIYDQGREFLTQLLGIPGPESAKLFVLFGFGLYLGLLTAFTIDIKKRVQAMLLWLGTTLVIAAIAVLGWVIPRVAATPLNGLGFVLGFVAGLVVEFDQFRAIDIDASSFRRPTMSNGTLPEFRYAAWLLFTLLTLIVVATLGQVFLAGTIQVFDPVITAIFLIVMFQFVSYESETSYVTLGPERSGKSMLMLGLSLTLLRNEEMHPNPNDYLQQSLERASNLQADQAKWPIPSTGLDDLQRASFEVIAGYYFPRRLELTALDYAGQHLTRIAELFQSGTNESAQDESVPSQVVSWISETDTLLFILDVERLEYPDAFHEGTTEEGAISWGLDQYTTIVEEVNPNDTIVVATKCDILIDKGHVDSPQSYDTYAGFREAITQHLSARPDVEELLATTGESTIHPLYFVTEYRDDSYVPHLDEDRNLIPVGYDHMIEEMRSRQ